MDISEQLVLTNQTELEDILIVIEGKLIVSTDDHTLAREVYQGFQYLLACEFRRQQPELALLYEIEFYTAGIEEGSVIYEWWARFKLRSSAKKALKATVGAAAVIGTLMGPLDMGLHIWDELHPPVQHQLTENHPHIYPEIVIIQIRPPDGREYFNPETGGDDFTL